MELSREQLLDQLQEEAAEVIWAAAKIKRFGWRRQYPGYGINTERLAEEMGQLQAVIDVLCKQHLQHIGEVRAFEFARAAHLAKVERQNADLGPIV